METFEVESCVQGHHVYQRIWTPTLGEELHCEREDANSKDLYAVAVIKGRDTVGHVPRRISAACSLFLRRGRRIGCIIMASRLLLCINCWCFFILAIPISIAKSPNLTSRQIYRLYGIHLQCWVQVQCCIIGLK